MHKAFELTPEKPKYERIAADLDRLEWFPIEQEVGDVICPEQL
jgi:hypothetical protein